jgi:hypothetical protein
MPRFVVLPRSGHRLCRPEAWCLGVVRLVSVSLSACMVRILLGATPAVLAQGAPNLARRARDTSGSHRSLYARRLRPAAASGGDNTVKLWSTAWTAGSSGRWSPTTPIHAVAISPTDPRRVHRKQSRSPDDNVKVWRLSDGALLQIP